MRASVATRSNYLQAVPGATPSNDVDGKNGTRNVDFSASYKISKKFSVSLEAINLTNQANDLYTSSVRNSVVQNTVTGRGSWSARGWTSKRIVSPVVVSSPRPPPGGRHVCHVPAPPPHSPTVGRACRSAIGGLCSPGTPMLTTKFSAFVLRPRCLALTLSAQAAPPSPSRPAVAASVRWLMGYSAPPTRQQRHQRCLRRRQFLSDDFNLAFDFTSDGDFGIGFYGLAALASGVYDFDFSDLAGRLISADWDGAAAGLTLTVLDTDSLRLSIDGRVFTPDANTLQRPLPCPSRQAWACWPSGRSRSCSAAAPPPDRGAAMHKHLLAIFALAGSAAWPPWTRLCKPRRWMAGPLRPAAPPGRAIVCRGEPDLQRQQPQPAAGISAMAASSPRSSRSSAAST